MASIKRNGQQLIIEDRPTVTDDKKEANKQLIEAQRQEDMRMVKGIFKNLECPNGCLKFAQRKYKQESVVARLFFDNKEYEVPLYVAKYLNNNCSYPVHTMSTDSEGKPIETVGRMVNRFAFISTEYR